MTLPSGAPLLAALCPPGAQCAESRGDIEGLRAGTVLLPGEEARIARAVPARVREYLTCRHLAHEALARIGVTGPVLSGPVGQPLWPEGVVGSITHCPGLRAAVVAPGRALRGLGVDAELYRPLPEAACRALVMPADVRPDLEHGEVVLLSVKEAVSKAVTSATGRVIDFRRVVVTGWGAGTCVTEAPSGIALGCRWAIREGLVLCVVAVPHGVETPRSTMSSTVA